MQHQPNPSPYNQFPMRELEQIEAAMNASQNVIATLEPRRTFLWIELDRITKPVPELRMPATKTIGPGLEYRGSMFMSWTKIDIHVDLLRRLWTEFPERRDAMAAAIGMCGNTRVYIARTRDALFPGRDQDFVGRYSRHLVDGWFVDTNLNLERMRRISPAAVRAAGLKWKEDVKIFWRATKI